MDVNQTVLEDFIVKLPFSAAQVLERLNADEVAEFVKNLPFEQCLGLLDHMNTQKAAHCFVLLPQELAVKLMENGNIFFVESLSRQLDTQFRENLFNHLSPARSAQLRRRLQMEPNTVGFRMVAGFVVNKEISVKEALGIIKANKANLTSHFFVVDSSGILEGAIGLRDLLWADKKISLEELLDTNVPKFLSDTPVETVVDHPGWTTYQQIPVIDTTERLLGVLSYQTIKEIGSGKAGQATEGILETGKALGELYWIGLTSLLQSVRK